jgi:hypothetical protein
MDSQAAARRWAATWTAAWQAHDVEAVVALYADDCVHRSTPFRPPHRPIGTLDVYAADPRGWDQSEVTALQAYAGVVASLLAAAAKAELKGALAEQLQVALDSRGLIERAKGALMERERLHDLEAFTHLRRAARSSGRKLSEVAREVADGQPLPRGRTRPTSAPAKPPKSDTGDPPQEA